MGEPTLLPEVKPSYGDLANFIGGEWRTPRATEWLEDANPANGRVIARVPLSTKEDVDEAVQAALAAWDEWRETPPLSRARYLFALDFRDAEAYAATFTEDGVLDYGAGKIVGRSEEHTSELQSR